MLRCSLPEKHGHGESINMFEEVLAHRKLNSNLPVLVAHYQAISQYIQTCAARDSVLARDGSGSFNRLLRNSNRGRVMGDGISPISPLLWGRTGLAAISEGVLVSSRVLEMSRYLHVIGKWGTMCMYST